MKLLDVLDRTRTPAPWAEGEKIPWNDPAFSERMLKEHLTQEHDMASRRFEKIDAHVSWIHNELLSGNPTRILDLGCGPGLYSNRLTRLGHECVGIDFSPASIAYAIESAKKDNLAHTFRHEDVRTAEYGVPSEWPIRRNNGAGFGLAMFIYGEFNTFRPADVTKILGKMFDALPDGGLLLLEVSTFESLEEMGKGGSRWYAEHSGLFSAQPHLCLTEDFWDADDNVFTTRFFVVDAASGDVTQHGISTKAYTDEQYRDLLAECGFTGIEFLPSLTGSEDESQKHMFAIVARR